MLRPALAGGRTTEAIFMSMNREAALEDFVSLNLTLLTSKQFDRKDFKAASRRYFYEQHKNKHGSPSLSDVLNALVLFLRKRGTPLDRIDAMIDNLPAFRQIGERQIETLKDLLSIEKPTSVLSESQLEDIRKVGAFAAVERHKGSEIEARKENELRELDRQIQEKRQEYDQLPSVLEQEVIEEPEFDPKAEQIRRWWERFYLRDDPFRQKDGLDSIDKSLYDAVVVRTKPFTEALGLLARNSKGMFGTASLLLGDYGFGKTTFIDYLSYFLVKKGIVPIRVISGRPHSDAGGFIDDFYVRLRTCLRAELKASSRPSGSDVADQTIDTQVVELASKLVQSGRAGIVIFLDDYHKHRSAFPAIYEFLGTLQILKDEFARKAIPTGFIVSGLPEWGRQIPTNSQMTGFLDGPVYEMPKITPDTVTAVFNQRIAAFCYDDHRREIKLQYVRHIFSEAGKSSGYRDYLTRIVSELESNNYAIVNTPIEVDEAKLQQIKGVIESDEMLKSAFKKLVFESKFKKFNREQVAKCVELLVQTSLHHGLSEDDVLFLDSKFYFNRLRELGLTQKRKEGSPKSFKWVIHSRLQTRLDDVHKKFGENINDYLLKLYAYKDYGAQVSAASAVGDDALAETRKFLNRSIGLTQSAKDNLGVAFHAYESGTDAARAVQNPRGAVQHCIQAFEALSNAFFEIDGTMASFQRANLEGVRDRWQGHWYAEESLAEFYGRIDRFRETESAGDASQVSQSLESLFRSIIERLKTIVEDVADSNASVGLLHNLGHHTTDEIALFDRIRSDFFSSDRNAHFEYVKRMTDYLEERFRSFLYVTTQMVFGKNYFDHVPGTQTKQYAYKNLGGRGNFASVENLYVGLTRPQFRQIFVAGGSIKTQIVDALSMPWLSADWDKFFDTFTIRNIETAHYQRAAFSACDRPSYLNYCRMAEQLLSGLNKLVSRSLTDYAFILADNHRPRSPEDCTVKFCFKVKEAKDAPMPESHVLTQDHAKMVSASPAEPISLDSAALVRVRDLLMMKLDASVSGFHTEDMTNIEYIVNHYNVPFIEFLALLVYLLRVERSIQVVPWFGSAVLVRRGE